MLRRVSGFTLIEMLVVMAVLALLLAIASPRYIAHIDAAKEIALKEDLLAVRDSIDKFYTDHERYPKNIEELIQTRYLRSYPVDPLTDRMDTWVFVNASDSAGGIRDIKSGDDGVSRDGSRYADW